MTCSFALFGSLLARAGAADRTFSAVQGQRALQLTLAFALVLLASILDVTHLTRAPEPVAKLEAALIKGFGTALESSELNPHKKDKKGEMRM